MGTTAQGDETWELLIVVTVAVILYLEGEAVVAELSGMLNDKGLIAQGNSTIHVIAAEGVKQELFLAIACDVIVAHVGGNLVLVALLELDGR